MSKFTAYKCDGCGIVEEGTKKRRKQYGYTSYEDAPPKGWQSLQVPGKRGHVCSEPCVDSFAKHAVETSITKAREAFSKKKGKATASV